MVIDLPLDIQDELRAFDARGDRISHYELLGIGADADGGAIRRAYLERSKRFHPDSWYRKELGDLGAVLSRTFQRMAAAYQILSDDETRAEYDRDHAAAFSEGDRTAAGLRAQARKEEERRQHERRERDLAVDVRPNEIVVQLPHAQLLGVEQDAVEVLAFENGFWNRISANDLQSELSILPQLARQKAAESNLPAEAERALQQQLNERIHTPQPLRLVFTGAMKKD